jgi:hypothetical protein
MATRPIKITASNEITGWLQLDDHGHTHAEAGDTIQWQISNHSGVYSIVTITKKSGSNFWSIQPHAQGANWKGTISLTAQVFDQYVYSIHWKASENGPVLIHDPIISIKPSVLRVISIISIAILGIFAIKFLRKKNK